MYKRELKRMIKFGLVFLIMMVFSICLVACEKNEDSNYEYGMFDEDIEREFELVDDSNGQIAVSGQFETVVVNYAQTVDGGMVAWKDGNYCYTSEDMSAMNLCSHFALHFEYIEPVKFN